MIASPSFCSEATINFCSKSTAMDSVFLMVSSTRCASFSKGFKRRERSAMYSARSFRFSLVGTGESAFSFTGQTAKAVTVSFFSKFQPQSYHAQPLS